MPLSQLEWHKNPATRLLKNPGHTDLSKKPGLFTSMFAGRKRAVTAIYGNI